MKIFGEKNGSKEKDQDKVKDETTGVPKVDELKNDSADKTGVKGEGDQDQDHDQDQGKDMNGYEFEFKFVDNGKEVEKKIFFGLGNEDAAIIEARKQADELSAGRFEVVFSGNFKKVENKN